MITKEEIDNFLSSIPDNTVVVVSTPDGINRVGHKGRNITAYQMGEMLAGAFVALEGATKHFCDGLPEDTDRAELLAGFSRIIAENEAGQAEQQGYLNLRPVDERDERKGGGT